MLFRSLLGATLALAQRDIKRSLAYSTMSQLGYIMGKTSKITYATVATLKEALSPKELKKNGF